MARAGIERPASVARAMYRSLGQGLADLLALVLDGRGARLAAVRIQPSALQIARRAPRGAVVATAHTGSWDLVACRIAREVPFTVVTKRLSVRLLDRLWQGVRARRGVRLVGAGRAASAVQSALGRHELVAMLVDQAPERRRAVVRAPFLGAECWVDLAPALCAMRARVPLVAAFPFRCEDGSHSVHVAGVIEPPARASRAWVERSMIQITLWLDRFVREHPEQWLWMHRRWKDLPPLAGPPAEG